MKSFALKMTSILALSFLTTTAFANSEAVQACTLDSWTSERIAEIPEDHREPVYALDNTDTVVGAVQYEPSTGEIQALYLCGHNSNYYYAEGSVWEHGHLDSFYNDEYESEFETFLEDYSVEVYVKSVKFVGEPEDADYPEFSTGFRFAFFD